MNGKKRFFISIAAAITLLSTALCTFLYFRPESRETVQIPVLMYHHLTSSGNNSTIITPAHFERQLQLIQREGYTAVSLQDLVDFVYNGGTLPKKPVLLTFDDGYESVYLEAFPLLKKYQMKAASFLIGVSVGSKTHYKNTNYPIIPHYDWDQARDMQNSGLVTIQSHTYDMHQYAPDETGNEEVRENALPLKYESKKAYRAAFLADFTKSASDIQQQLGISLFAFAYPGGKYTATTQKILKEQGVKVTFTTDVGVNYVTRNKPATLQLMKRFNVTDAVDDQTLLSFLNNTWKP